MSKQVIDVYPADADGFTQKAYIRGVPLTYNAHRIEYRPMYSIDRALFVKLRAQGDERGLAVAINRAMASRILKWDIQEFDKDGNPTGELPIAEKSIERLNPLLWFAIQNVVVWGAGGDIDPENEQARSKTKAELELEAAITGRPIGDLKLEAQQGNS